MCRFLRRRYDEVSLPILILTVRGGRHDLAEGFAAGANDYLAKPYEEIELVARTQTLLRVRRQHEALRRRERGRDLVFESANAECRRIVGDRDGTIDVVSTQAEGTTFTVRLPLTIAP